MLSHFSAPGCSWVAQPGLNTRLLTTKALSPSISLEHTSVGGFYMVLKLIIFPLSIVPEAGRPLLAHQTGDLKPGTSIKQQISRPERVDLFSFKD